MVPMKIFKIVLPYAGGVLVLFLLLEGACKLGLIPPLTVFQNENTVQSRMNGSKLDRQTLLTEFGQDIFKSPPPANTANYDFEKLKQFTYADIDQTPVKDRQWAYSQDGTSRSSRFTKKIKNSGEVIYDVIYRTNNQDKRIVEGQEKKKNADSFILAGGDSFTFGEGVTQGQDFPSVLASKISGRWRVYNFGVSGDSANDFLIRTEFNPEYFSEIKESSGIFIWTYLDIQMQRLIYPTSAYKFSYIAKKPDFSLENDELVFHGFFKDGKSTLRPFIDWMAGLAITKTFNLEIPKVYTEENYRLFFKLLNTTLSHIETSGHKISKKIFVTYIAHQNTEALKKIANESGFEILDIEKIMYVRDQRFGGDLNLTIPVDGHPSPEAYWLLGTALATGIPR